MTSDSRSYILSQIKSFPGVATYPTSWAGSLSFQQLYDDLAHYVTNVMKGKGIHRTNYLPKSRPTNRKLNEPTNFGSAFRLTGSFPALSRVGERCARPCWTVSSVMRSCHHD